MVETLSEAKARRGDLIPPPPPRQFAIDDRLFAGPSRFGSKTIRPNFGPAARHVGHAGYQDPTIFPDTAFNTHRNSSSTSSVNSSLSGSSQSRQDESLLFQEALSTTSHRNRAFTLPLENNQLIVNPYYRQAIERNDALQNRLETMNFAYITLAKAVPQVFTVIPNPFNIPIPASTPLTVSHNNQEPPPPAPTREQCPNIRWFLRKDWKKELSTLGDHLDSDADSDSDSASTSQVLGFLEHANGTRFDEAEIAYVRSCAQTEFNTFLHEKLAPPTWSQATADTIARFRRNLIAAIPDVNLGANYWKVDTVGSKVYSQWSRYRKEDLSRRD
ncbi:hypothetical protein B0H13DRAFT_1881939 [Mycena leptocephala]|nr:hypothetical protein B0H13DRAFT_1881939 [Mycena leptocephala]